MIDIKSIQKKYEEVTNQLRNPELISDWERFEKLSEEKKFLESVIKKKEEIEEVEHRIQENRSILASQEDPELVSLAEEDLNGLIEKKKKLEKELENLISLNDNIKPPQKSSNQTNSDLSYQNIIIEIRAGTGGKEAALFAADLYRMYSKYSQKQGWKQKILDSRPTELGGFKEIIFELMGNSVFSKMKYEGGVHRVQRIPKTEKGGRIHTSTVSVAILPKPKKAEIKIKPENLKIDYYKASGPGGQYVNKRETAVRITHLPTGLSVSCQTERSLQKNKENALSILAARLLEKRVLEEEDQLSKKRKVQIGKAKRAEKIRTYNFPQNRVTDHRIKKSFHNIEEIMDGKLEPIIERLQSA